MTNLYGRWVMKQCVEPRVCCRIKSESWLVPTAGKTCALVVFRDTSTSTYILRRCHTIVTTLRSIFCMQLSRRVVSLGSIFCSHSMKVRTLVLQEREPNTVFWLSLYDSKEKTALVWVSTRILIQWEWKQDGSLSMHLCLWKQDGSLSMHLCLYTDWWIPF